MNTTVIQNNDTSYQENDLTNQTEAPQEQPQSDKPAWLPEKFNNAEELAKAYGELEKAYSAKNPTAEQPQQQPTQEQVEQATGLNLDASQEVKITVMQLKIERLEEKQADLRERLKVVEKWVIGAAAVIVAGTTLVGFATNISKAYL